MVREHVYLPCLFAWKELCMCYCISACMWVCVGRLSGQEVPFVLNSFQDFFFLRFCILVSSLVFVLKNYQSFIRNIFLAITKILNLQKCNESTCKRPISSRCNRILRAGGWSKPSSFFDVGIQSPSCVYVRCNTDRIFLCLPVTHVFPLGNVLINKNKK